MLTAADQFRAEGRAQGKIRALTLFLQERLGGVPDGVAELMEAATLEQIDNWSIRLFNGESPEAVFGKTAAGNL